MLCLWDGSVVFCSTWPSMPEAGYLVSHIVAAVPSAWTRAETDAIQQARHCPVRAALDRLAPDALSDGEIAEATELGQRACDGISCNEGKPLAAGNRAAPLPSDPLVALWQLLTVIREWRGDAHVAVLCTEPLTAVEALVLEGGRSLPIVQAEGDTRLE